MSKRFCIFAILVGSPAVEESIAAIAIVEVAVEELIAAVVVAMVAVGSTEDQIYSVIHFTKE